MNESDTPRNLEQLLDRLEETGSGDEPVELGAVIEATGQRSFAPLLLLAGLIALSPLSGIPGMPTLVALLVLLIAVQLLLRRSHFWLPQWLMRRRIPRRRLRSGIHAARRPARFVDRYLRSRLTRLTAGTGLYVIALVCTAIALTMPALELLPFAATIAGAALTVFGLSLIAHDGVLALAALTLTTGVGGLIVGNLL